MKKRLLLIIIAGVCLSPSVFADVGYVGTAPTVFAKDPHTGKVTSEKGNCASVGPFERRPASCGSAPVNPAPPSQCDFAQKRIDDHNGFIQKLDQKLHSGDANG